MNRAVSVHNQLPLRRCSMTTKTKIELPGKVTYVKMSEKKAGETLVIGSYLGAKSQPNFNNDGMQTVHSFSTEEGEVRLNGSRLLDTLLTQVKTGDILEVVYCGKEPGQSKDGKKFRRNLFEVLKLEEKS